MKKELPHYRRLQNLAGLLIRRPDLAGHVREFTLRLADVTALPEDFKEFKEREESNVNQAFLTAINEWKLSKENKKIWLSEFDYPRNCCSDLYIALLLPSLLNVQKLVFDCDVASNTPHLADMMRRAARGARPFKTQPPFKWLTVFVDKSFNPWGTLIIASLLKLPAIREISSVLRTPHNIHLTVEDQALKQLSSASSSITSFNLKDGKLSAATLSHILRAPKALKIFFYTCYIVKDIELKLTDICQALKP